MLFDVLISELAHASNSNAAEYTCPTKKKKKKKFKLINVRIVVIIKYPASTFLETNGTLTGL